MWGPDSKPEPDMGSRHLSPSASPRSRAALRGLGCFGGARGAPWGQQDLQDPSVCCHPLLRPYEGPSLCRARTGLLGDGDPFDSAAPQACGWCLKTTTGVCWGALGLLLHCTFHHPRPSIREASENIGSGVRTPGHPGTHPDAPQTGPDRLVSTYEEQTRNSVAFWGVASSAPQNPK